LQIGEKDANEEKKKIMSRRVNTVKSLFLDKNNSKTPHTSQRPSLYVIQKSARKKETLLLEWFNLQWEISVIVVFMFNVLYLTG
jgi:hypothetical protein